MDKTIYAHSFTSAGYFTNNPEDGDTMLLSNFPTGLHVLSTTDPVLDHTMDEAVGRINKESLPDNLRISRFYRFDEAFIVLHDGRIKRFEPLIVGADETPTKQDSESPDGALDFLRLKAMIDHAEIEA